MLCLLIVAIGIVSLIRLFEAPAEPEPPTIEMALPEEHTPTSIPEPVETVPPQIEETPEPSATPIPVSAIDYLREGGAFELPVRGASGYAAVQLRVRTRPEANADTRLTLAAGAGFTILEEAGDWWKIGVGEDEGWVRYRYAFINLPDVLPSIVYDITNAYASRMRSDGVAIPNITGYALYEARAFNPRLGRYEFIVPVRHETARRISLAQQTALAEGNTLILYEVFRPRAAQREIVSNLQNLINTNAQVRDAINTPPWHIGWFISTSISSH